MGGDVERIDRESTFFYSIYLVLGVALRVHFVVAAIPSAAVERFIHGTTDKDRRIEDRQGRGFRLYTNNEEGDGYLTAFQLPVTCMLPSQTM